MQSINSIKAYAYGLNIYLAYKNEEIKCNIKKNNTKMINFDEITRENIKKR